MINVTVNRSFIYDVNKEFPYEGDSFFFVMKITFKREFER